MDDGLVPNRDGKISKFLVSLNPYCSGRWSRTLIFITQSAIIDCLNPCCSGRWSRTFILVHFHFLLLFVLILVVGEDGLARVANKFNVTFGVMS